ncbi:MAG: DNA polymerase I, partial [Oscillospiraceae bacterium]|nr:DNA polymerase I [Oscillospiraceae bacterium]
MRILAVDGNSIMNRAFYGIRLLSNKSGVYTNAIYGFLNILLKLKAQLSPDAVVVAFDVSAPTFRKDIYSEYKANRKGMPNELRVQMPIIKQLLDMMGDTVLELEGYEGDDILGTVAQKCSDTGHECYISTGDRDNLQLINDNVKVALATTKETIIYDEQKFREDYGFAPINLIDLKAIMGDSSDNIPGVKGVGEKSGVDLIQKYANIDYIYENIGQIEAKPNTKKLLEASKEMAYISKKLATICCNVPIELDFGKWVEKESDLDSLAQKLVELELNTFIEKFDLQEKAKSVKKSAQKPAQTLEIVKDISLADLKSKLGEKVYFFCDFDADEPIKLSIHTNGFVTIVENNVKSALDMIFASGKQLFTIDIKQIYRYMLKNGIEPVTFAFDAALAGYLLNCAGKEYTADVLNSAYADESFDVDDEFMSIAQFKSACENMAKELSQKDMEKLLHEIEMPLSLVLASMELVGFEVDAGGVARFGEFLQEQIEKCKQEIYNYSECEFNINSTKELGAVLFEKLALPTKKKTKTGYSTSAEVLEGLRGKHPIIEPLLEYRKLSKLNSTYVVGLLKVVSPDGRIHSIFKQTETRTGRISSTEPNMQNIPIRSELGSKMREFFVAKEGYTLIDADYSQIELRILAHISNDQMMIDAFNSGLDIHSITASEVFNVPQLLLTPIMRSRAKAINFGIVYGIGAFSLSQDINTSVAE